MEFVFRRFVEQSAGRHFIALGLRLFGRADCAGRRAAARRVGCRAHHGPPGKVVSFARKIAGGDLEARLDAYGDDELATMEAALNQTAQRLGQDFAEIESRRQELVTMLDSMQEAVIAVTREGLVRWSNAVMQQFAATQIVPGRPLVHSVRDPEVLACVACRTRAGRGALRPRQFAGSRARI